MGIQAIKKNDEFKRAYEEKGRVLTEAKLDHVQRSWETFRGHLELFAKKHKQAIQNDPEFRQTFTLMCNQLGVDPLASNKGFWAELFGLGDYYFDLGVKIIAMAISTREANGGILEIETIAQRLNAQNERNAKALAAAGGGGAKKPQKSTVITQEDIIKAVDKVASLGTLKIGLIGNKRVLFSVPFEWNQDQSQVLEFASERKCQGISAQAVSRRFGWLDERSNRALVHLAAEGLAWLDEPAKEYWFPSFAGVSF